MSSVVGSVLEQIETRNETELDPSITMEGNNIEAFADSEGANARRYVIDGFNASTNPSLGEGDSTTECVILFHNGSPTEGFNGVVAQDLIEVCISLFEDYQTTEFKCEENEEIIEHLVKAKNMILQRLRRRVKHGKLGTQQPD